MKTLENLFKETTKKIANERDERRNHFLAQLKLADEWCDRTAEQLSFLKGNGFDVFIERRPTETDDSGIRIIHIKSRRDVFIRPYVTCELKVLDVFKASSLYSPFGISDNEETVEGLVKKLAEWV